MPPNSLNANPDRYPYAVHIRPLKVMERNKTGKQSNKLGKIANQST